MEKSRAALSHFGGIIRLVVLIVLIAIVAFFVITFMRNRHGVKTAERASQQVASETDSSSKKEPASGDESVAENDDEPVIPSGIAEGDSPASATTSSVPAAGMGIDMVFTASILALVAFFYAKNKQLTAELQQLH